jgi:hypothetical protein
MKDKTDLDEEIKDLHEKHSKIHIYKYLFSIGVEVDDINDLHKK